MMDNQPEKSEEAEKTEARPTSADSASSNNLFNPNAVPFEPSSTFQLLKYDDSYESITVGPSQVPVNAKIWDKIVSNRVLPDLPPVGPSENGRPFAMPSTSNAIPVIPLNNFVEPSSYSSHPPPFDVDQNRDVVVFRRDFGPIATNEGVELRLHFGVRVLISLDGAVLIEMGDIRIAVSSDGHLSAMEHPNGGIYQQPDRVDVVAFDGQGKNNFIRYAKIWKDCISLTADGCALIYLVDTAGTRTTSDQVNRDWSRDYCRKVFIHGMNFRREVESNYGADHYRYKLEPDGTHVFIISDVRISQASDGMTRVQSDSFSIRASVENRSMALTTRLIHCTASMGTSPHLFIRINERRVHFDGTNFVVRNMGHSSSFDGANNLRIH